MHSHLLCARAEQSHRRGHGRKKLGFCCRGGRGVSVGLHREQGLKDALGKVERRPFTCLRIGRAALLTQRTRSARPPGRARTASPPRPPAPGRPRRRPHLCAQRGHRAEGEGAGWPWLRQKARLSAVALASNPSAGQGPGFESGFWVKVLHFWLYHLQSSLTSYSRAS